MPQNFRDAVRRAIDDGLPLAWEMYRAWLALTGDDEIADWITADLIWRHAQDREHGVPN